MAAKTSEDLERLLGKLGRAAASNGARLSVGELVEAIGRRSFGPLLLLCGLLGMTPVSAVPSVPTILAILTILIAGQLLFGRKSVWLPKWLANLSVKAAKVKKAVEVSRKPARIADRIVRPRLAILTGPVADRLVAACCCVIAAVTPVLEFLPFVAFVPSLAIATFGLALIARDGLVVLVGLLISGGALGFGLWTLLT